MKSKLLSVFPLDIDKKLDDLPLYLDAADIDDVVNLISTIPKAYSFLSDKFKNNLSVFAKYYESVDVREELKLHGFHDSLMDGISKDEASFEIKRFVKDYTIIDKSENEINEYVKLLLNSNVMVIVSEDEKLLNSLRGVIGENNFFEYIVESIIDSKNIPLLRVKDCIEVVGRLNDNEIPFAIYRLSCCIRDDDEDGIEFYRFYKKIKEEGVIDFKNFSYFFGKHINSIDEEELKEVWYCSDIEYLSDKNMQYICNLYLFDGLYANRDMALLIRLAESDKNRIDCFCEFVRHRPLSDKLSVFNDFFEILKTKIFFLEKENGEDGCVKFRNSNNVFNLFEMIRKFSNNDEEQIDAILVEIFKSLKISDISDVSLASKLYEFYGERVESIYLDFIVSNPNVGSSFYFHDLVSVMGDVKYGKEFADKLFKWFEQIGNEGLIYVLKYDVGFVSKNDFLKDNLIKLVEDRGLNKERFLVLIKSGNDFIESVKNLNSMDREFTYELEKVDLRYIDKNVINFMVNKVKDGKIKLVSCFMFLVNLLERGGKKQDFNERVEVIKNIIDGFASSGVNVYSLLSEDILNRSGLIQHFLEKGYDVSKSLTSVVKFFEKNSSLSQDKLLLKQFKNRFDCEIKKEYKPINTKEMMMYMSCDDLKDLLNKDVYRGGELSNYLLSFKDGGLKEKLFNDFLEEYKFDDDFLFYMFLMANWNENLKSGVEKIIGNRGLIKSSDDVNKYIIDNLARKALSKESVKVLIDCNFLDKNAVDKILLTAQFFFEYLPKDFIEENYKDYVVSDDIKFRMNYRELEKDKLFNDDFYLSSVLARCDSNMFLGLVEEPIKYWGGCEGVSDVKCKILYKCLPLGIMGNFPFWMRDSIDVLLKLESLSKDGGNGKFKIDMSLVSSRVNDLMNFYEVSELGVMMDLIKAHKEQDVLLNKYKKTIYVSGKSRL